MPVRRGLAALLAALSLCLLASISRAAEQSLRISGWALPFNLPVMVELDQGAYSRAFPDFEVSAPEIRSGPALMAALEAGDLDIVQGIGDAAFLVAVVGGIDARVIAVNSRSPKAFAVVTGNPEVKSASDLRGRSVVGMRGSVVHEVFLSALGEAGMSEADVEFFPMPVASAASTLLAGRADAALLVGSEVLRAVKSGARVLADGEGRVSGLSLAVASGKFLSSHPDFAGRFRALRLETNAWIESNRDEAVRIAAVRTRQDASDVLLMMDWYDFAPGVASEDVRSMEATEKYLRENRLLNGDAAVSPLFMQ
jgi:sulfonate transport system substrate-binding protein